MIMCTVLLKMHPNEYRLELLWWFECGFGNERKISFINYRNQLTNYPINKCMKIRHLLMDKTNTLWIATTNGMFKSITFNS